MKRMILVAAGALLIASANSPAPSDTADRPYEGELTSVVAAEPQPAAAPAPATRVAGDYPRCSATVRDRCVQGRWRAAHPVRREVQLAMRAGERG
jgi:hypothetical protein